MACRPGCEIRQKTPRLPPPRPESVLGMLKELLHVHFLPGDTQTLQRSTVEMFGSKCVVSVCGHAPDAGHVEVGDLHDLGEGVDAGRRHRPQLLLRHLRQRPHKVHDRIAVQQPTAQSMTAESADELKVLQSSSMMLGKINTRHCAERPAWEAQPCGRCAMSPKTHKQTACRCYRAQCTLPRTIALQHGEQCAELCLGGPWSSDTCHTILSDGERTNLRMNMRFSS